MMKKTVVALFASAFLGGTAVAGEKMGYEALDTDGDGVISAEEASASPELTDSWQTLDINADGVVDRSEFSAFETMEPQKHN